MPKWPCTGSTTYKNIISIYIRGCMDEVIAYILFVDVAAMSSCSPPKDGSQPHREQNITTNEVMKKMFFVTDEEWEKIKLAEEFDYVVVGSSFCALGFIAKVAKNNPTAKILVLEQGQYFLPCHFQNLSPVYACTRKNASETFPWSLSEKMEGKDIKKQRGTWKFFGGRSLFWSGWCPKPEYDEMQDWPPEVVKVVHDYFGEVKELINVTTADQVFREQYSAKPVYGKLQEVLQDRLENVSDNVEAVTRMIPGPLSINFKGYR